MALKSSLPYSRVFTTSGDGDIEVEGEEVSTVSEADSLLGTVESRCCPINHFFSPLFRERGSLEKTKSPYPLHHGTPDFHLVQDFLKKIANCASWSNCTLHVSMLHWGDRCVDLTQLPFLYRVLRRFLIGHFLSLVFRGGKDGRPNGGWRERERERIRNMPRWAETLIFSPRVGCTGSFLPSFVNCRSSCVPHGSSFGGSHRIEMSLRGSFFFLVQFYWTLSVFYRVPFLFW